MLALPNPAPHKGAFALLLHRGGGGGGRHTYPRPHTSQAGPPMPAAQRVSEAGQGTLKSWPFLPYLPGGCKSHCVVTIAGQGPPETLATPWSQAGLTSKAWWLEGVASKHLHNEDPQPAARSDDFQAAGAGGGRVLKRTRKPAGTRGVQPEAWGEQGSDPTSRWDSKRSRGWMAGLICNLPREGFGWRGSWLLKIWNTVRAQPSCSSSFKKTVFKGLVLAFFFFLSIHFPTERDGGEGKCTLGVHVRPQSAQQTPA